MALKTYLESKRTDIVGGSDIENKLHFILDEFDTDTGIPAIMVRETGGGGGNNYLPTFTTSTFQLWTRAKQPPQAKTLIRNVDVFLHRYGPALMTNDVYVWHIGRNTNPQRMDDPDTHFAQYFCLYDVVYREADGA